MILIICLLGETMSKIVTVKVYNLDRLIKKFDKLKNPPDLTQPMKRCTLKVQKEARIYISTVEWTNSKGEQKIGKVKTGMLRRAVQPYVTKEGKDTIGVVYNNMEYASDVHFGHKIMGGPGRKEVVGMVAPAPFLTVGLERSKEYINTTIADAIREHNRESIS